jgi:glucose-1-phosphate adenylyltransferase
LNVNSVLTMILAGGKGTRLEPLTRDRAKPAVPFGGIYRIIDFTLSNCINSGLRKILVLTQYKAASLDRHITMGWNFFSRELDEYIDVLPPQQRIDDQWYRGTADAIYQNIYTIERTDPRLVLILAGDHIYKMDYMKMIRFHLESQADLTVGCIPVPLADCRHFGVMETDNQNRITNFVEKPPQTQPMPGEPRYFLASMGIYVFNARLLYELLFQDAARNDSRHDFGTDIIPQMLGQFRVLAYRFQDRNRKDLPYWRDVGTLDAYYQANMDLVDTDPLLNLYDQEWPIRTYQPQIPPPKFVFEDIGEGPSARRGEAHNSMVCQGCIISGGHVRGSILSPRVRINSYSLVENSILLDGVQVGRHCRIRNAIVDKYVNIPAGTEIGQDLARDQDRGLTITDKGIVIVPKGEITETFLG